MLAVKQTQKAAREASAARTPSFPAALPASSQILPQRKSCACGGGCPRCRQNYPRQAKLEVSPPGDVLEQEADRIAEQVLRMPPPELPGNAQAHKGTALRLSRYASGAPAQSSAEVPPIVHSVVRSPGEPLDPATRAFMESRLGHDFGGVRVHTDDRAAESARTLGARAYTSGPDIAFAHGKYRPDTLDGRRLLAHELTHVVQQGVVQQGAGQRGRAIRRAARARVQLQRDPASSVCAGSDLSAMDVGTHAHIQIQQQFIAWCRSNRSGIGDCAIEDRLPLGSVKGNEGYPDMARRTTDTSQGTVWEIGEIKPVSWLVRGDEGRAIAQLQNYIAAVRVRGESAVPLEQFLPSTPVGPFRGNPKLDLYAMAPPPAQTGAPVGIYYYWCEGRGERETQKEPTRPPAHGTRPIVIELAPGLEEMHPSIETEFHRKIGSSAPEAPYAIIAPEAFFQAFVLGPGEEKLLARYRLRPPPLADAVAGQRNLFVSLSTIEAGVSAVVFALVAGALLAPALPAATGGGGVGAGALTVAEAGTVAGGLTVAETGGVALTQAVMTERIVTAVTAAAASPAVREMVKSSASVLLVVLVAKEAHGETSVSDVQAVQAVPLSSVEPEGSGDIGRPVTYLGERYFVVGRVTSAPMATP